MLRQWWKRHTDDADEGAARRGIRGGAPCVAAVAILIDPVTGRASVVSMNCQDAAAAGARAFAVDDAGESKARAAAVAAAGDSATVRFDRGADSVTVTVQCPVIPDPTGVLPARVTEQSDPLLLAPRLVSA